jgi:hypothetical protein
MFKPEPEHDADLEALLRATKRRRIMMFVTLGLVFGSPFMWMGWTVFRRIQHQRQREEAQRATPADRAELKTLLGQLDAALKARDAQWEQATSAAALTKVKPTDEPCSVTLQAPDKSAGESYSQYGSIDGYYFGSWSLHEISSGEGAGECPSCGYQRSELERVRGELDSEALQKSAVEWARRSVRYPDDEVVIFAVESRKKPVSLGDSFVPGVVSGRAYLYQGGRILCAGDVAAQSSTDVRTSFSYMKGNFLDESMKAREALNTALERDLTVQLRRAISGGLSSIQ